MDLKILISAPMDQAEEVRIALEAVEHLNTILEPHGHSISAKHWQKNLSTGRANRAQEVINAQAAECDAIVAIIGTRLGTPTGEHESGTAEEIYQFLERTNPTEVSYDVHVFFNAKDISNPFEIDATELGRVQKFRAGLNAKGINFAQFSSNDILRNLVQVGLNTLVGKAKPYIAPEKSDPLESFEELGSDDAVEIASEKLRLANTATIELAQSMNRMNEKLDKLTSSPISTADGREAAKKYLLDGANTLDEARRELSPLAKTMRENFDQSYAYMNLAISIMIEDAVLANDVPDFGELPSTITDVVAMAKKARGTFADLCKSLDRIPRRTKELRKAKKGLAEGYNEVLEALESFESDFSSLVKTMNNN